MVDQNTKNSAAKAPRSMELERTRPPIELLSDRVEKLEWLLAVLQKEVVLDRLAKPNLDPIVNQLNDLAANVASERAARPNLDPIVEQLNDLTANIDVMASHLKHSAGYRLHDSFECEECHSRGQAAVRITCTVCNRESWHGWFPRRSRR